MARFLDDYRRNVLKKGGIFQGKILLRKNQLMLQARESSLILSIAPAIINNQSFSLCNKKEINGGRRNGKNLEVLQR